MLLSISIPTYNREKLIIQTLNNVINEIRAYKLNNICSINVFDNCSYDKTVEVAESILSESNLTYKIYKSNKNLGAELNFDRCIRLPDAKYCWIFGSDDLLNEQAISRICNYLLSTQPKGGITVNYKIILDGFKNARVKLFTPELGKYPFQIGEGDLDKLDSKIRKRLISLMLGYLPFISSSIINSKSYSNLIKKPDLINGEGYDFIPWFFKLLLEEGWTYTGINAVKCRRDETNLDDASGFYGKDATNAYKVNIALFKIMYDSFSSLNSKRFLKESIRAYTFRYIIGDLIRMKTSKSVDYNVKLSLKEYINIVKLKYQSKFSLSFLLIKSLSLIDNKIYIYIKKIYSIFK